MTKLSLAKQLLITGFSGFEAPPTSKIASLIKQGLGGVILFDYDARQKVFEKNIRSPEQVKSLTNSLRSFAEEAKDNSYFDGKLLIMTDEEGGLVSRLKPAYGFTPSLSEQKRGLLPDAEIFNQACVIADNLTTAGINMNAAPCVDIAFSKSVIAEKERCFCENEVKTANAACLTAKAFLSKGILPVFKHFPGHGSTLTDTHEKLADISDTFEKRELFPYVAGLQNNVMPAVMVGHLWHRKIDAVYPASLSFEAQTRLLRQKIGFQGVIISDDIQMKALRNSYSLEEIVVRFFEAGGDILLLGNNLMNEEGREEEIFHLIAQHFSTERIEESLQRIKKMKEKIQN